ncbi:unnamed protein product [Trichobilharzia regenti]|nr:unnamed protein product [Trichobilharzia regenti]
MTVVLRVHQNHHVTVGAVIIHHLIGLLLKRIGIHVHVTDIGVPGHGVK